MVNNNNTVGSVPKSSSSEMSDDEEGDLASLLPPYVRQVSLNMLIDVLKRSEINFCVMLYV